MTGYMLRMNFQPHLVSLVLQVNSAHSFLQVVIFDGKADALFSGLFRFQKAFFLHPETKELYGRVQLQKGPLGNILYPLYYTCSIDPAIVPGISFCNIVAFCASAALAEDLLCTKSGCHEMFACCLSDANILPNLLLLIHKYTLCMVVTDNVHGCIMCLG